MLSDNNSVKVYGKTGTGKIGNADVNGWFIGYIETVDNTYVFAINIKNEKNANGQKAIEITTSIFERMGKQITLWLTRLSIKRNGEPTMKELLVAEEKSKADLLAVFKELGYEIKL